MAWAPAKQRARARSRRGGASNLVAIGAVAAAIVFVGAVIGILLTSGGPTATTAVGGSGTDPAAVGTSSTALTPTGEVSAMGVPVYETPGYASGSAEAGGITVQGSDWAMGQVPLDIAVRPFWTLTNTGRSPVRLGEPEAEIRAGCCPGPFTLGADTLAPGESTVLTFELAMSEGMDGWHDMGVYVPIEGTSGRELLELNVTGDFRN
jgi:hypothetical protein